MRYPGGKGKCFQHLINLMPPHEVYIESHLGGGAVIRHKRPAQRNIGIDLDPKVIALWQVECAPALELINQDAVEFLRSFSFTGKELVYSDPPYMPDTRRRARVYRYDYTDEAHIGLLATLRSLPCRVMVSGYYNPLYRDMLAGWRHVTFCAKSHVGMREESVWMNFAEPSVLHDSRYIGVDFRERQAVRRRQTALRRRISAMPAVERSELARWMNTTFACERAESLCSPPA